MLLHYIFLRCVLCLLCIVAAQAGPAYGLLPGGAISLLTHHFNPMFSLSSCVPWPYRAFSPSSNTVVPQIICRAMKQRAATKEPNAGQFTLYPG